jgi:hypothetical protein
MNWLVVQILEGTIILISCFILKLSLPAEHPCLRGQWQTTGCATPFFPEAGKERGAVLCFVKKNYLSCLLPML